ncbi:hypothetical protein OTU49_005847, partial [Cherax quadricarinatus]
MAANTCRFPVVVTLITASVSISLHALGHEGVQVHLPPGYPKKYHKMPTFQDSYASLYPGYPSSWEETVPQYPQHHPEYLASDHNYHSSAYHREHTFSSLHSGRSSGNAIGYPLDDISNIRYPENPVVGYPNYGYPVMGSSPNDVVNRTFVPPWDASIWDQPLDPDVCRTLAGLSRPQLHICTRSTDTVGAAAIGLNMAVRECLRQFANHRWNCTALNTLANNPHTAPIMARGYSESAFGHAITAAGVTHSIARACA